MGGLVNFIQTIFEEYGLIVAIIVGGLLILAYKLITGRD